MNDLEGGKMHFSHFEASHGWGRARRDRPFEMVPHGSNGSVQSGRIRHRETGHVLVRDGKRWVPAAVAQRGSEAAE